MDRDTAISLLRKRKGKSFLGEGSSRTVYEIDGYIIKKAKNKRGRVECANESWLYENIVDAIKPYLCPVLTFINGHIIMQKAETLSKELFENEVKNTFQHVIDFLVDTYDIDDFDLYHHFNWGLLDGKPVIIDYGHTYLGNELEFS